MYASTHINKGETILFIPDNLIITIEKALESELGQMMLKKELIIVQGSEELTQTQVDIRNVLVVHNLLEIEKGQES